MKAIKIFTAGLLLYIPAFTASAAEVTVYKSTTCDCCGKWIKHLEKNGFKVKAHDVSDITSYKIKHGIKPGLASCHTAIVDGYVIEGHVPAADIKRLLKTRPRVKGLSVPGMVVGSPGMESENRKDPYNVIQIHRNGSTSVYSRH